MNINDQFPSKYLKASDLQGRRIEVIMADVKTEKLGDDIRPVLYFKGKEKGVVLNKTNASTIINAYGPETDDWFGQPIILFEAIVDLPAGRGRGPAIRVDIPRRPRPIAERAQASLDRVPDLPPPRHDEWATQGKGRSEAGAGPILDDDIPFAPEMRG